MSSDATVVEAARVMRDDDVGLVPVVDGDRLVGTVTDRDIAIRVVAEERDFEQHDRPRDRLDGPGHDRPGAGARRGPPADGAAQVRRLPVVEEDGRLVGIVAQADVARHGDDTQTGQVVERISQ